MRSCFSGCLDGDEGKNKDNDHEKEEEEQGATTKFYRR